MLHHSKQIIKSRQADLCHENFPEQSEMRHTVTLHLNVNRLHLINMKFGKFMAGVLSVSLLSNIVGK